MSRLKLFVENLLVYGIGGVIGKIIPFIMLPIITRLMPNSQYFGLNDISTIVVSFGSAIAIMGMYDAMFRMFFDKDDQGHKKDICSTAFTFTLTMSLIVFGILILFKRFFALLFFGSVEYENLLLLSALGILVGTTNSIIAAPTRMQNKRKVFLVTNVITPIISYGISVPMLVGGMYITALPLANVVSLIIMNIIFFSLNKTWFKVKRFNKDLLKQMLYIALPLMPNFLVYWVFNSSDRLMIAKILGNEYVGVYAVGAKIGQVSQLIYTAFAGGWQYFAFSTMRDDDQILMTSNIFEYLGVITFTVGMYMAAVSDVVFRTFFEGDYIQGAIVAPYLFVAPLLLMLFQIACNQFIVIKKTWPNIVILVIGAFTNVIINLWLIPIVGIEGAAIGTLIGYIVSVLLCVIVLQRMKLLNISWQFKICSVVVIIYFISWRALLKESCVMSILVAFLVTCFYIVMYKGKLLQLLHKNKGE